jgi:hypothetical protein
MLENFCFFIDDDKAEWATVFVPGKPFHPGLIIAVKVGSLN